MLQWLNLAFSGVMVVAVSGSATLAIAMEPTVSGTPPSPSPSLSIPLLEQSVYEQVNQYRISQGLPPLQIDPRVSTQARSHSLAMAQRRIPVGHTGLRERALRVDRIIPSDRVSENVAYIFSHQDTAQRAVQGWLRSPNHRPSLEGPFSITGIGVAQGDRGAFYFTQLYVRPRSGGWSQTQPNVRTECSLVDLGRRVLPSVPGIVLSQLCR